MSKNRLDKTATKVGKERAELFRIHVLSQRREPAYIDEKYGNVATSTFKRSIAGMGCQLLYEIR